MSFYLQYSPVPKTKFPFQEVDLGDIRTARVFNAYNNNTQTITSTAATVLIDTLVGANDTGAYTLSSGEIQISYPDDYLITFTVPLTQLVTGAATVLVFLELNNILVPGSLIFTDIDGTLEGTTITGTALLSLVKDDIVRVRAQKFSGADVSTVSGTSSVAILSRKPATEKSNFGIDCGSIASLNSPEICIDCGGID